MDELRLINATPLEKEMLEYADYIGRETTNECESTAETCADMVSSAPTIDPESLPPHWRKSEETPPKKKDGDVLGSVFAVAYHRNIRNGIWLASNMPWHIVQTARRCTHSGCPFLNCQTFPRRREGAC